jgi:DNA-binding FrmR family transcriptional regulator
MGKSAPHRTHHDIVKRLKRAGGHLQMTITMIEEGKPCLDLAQQLQAVENAIDNAKKALIHDHIQHCLDGSMRMPGAKGRAAIAELRAITKYL